MGWGGTSDDEEQVMESQSKKMISAVTAILVARESTGREGMSHDELAGLLAMAGATTPLFDIGSVWRHEWPEWTKAFEILFSYTSGAHYWFTLDSETVQLSDYYHDEMARDEYLRGL